MCNQIVVFPLTIESSRWDVNQSSIPYFQFLKINIAEFCFAGPSATSQLHVGVEVHPPRMTLSQSRPSTPPPPLPRPWRTTLSRRGEGNCWGRAQSCPPIRTSDPSWTLSDPATRWHGSMPLRPTRKRSAPYGFIPVDWGGSLSCSLRSQMQAGGSRMFFVCLELFYHEISLCRMQMIELGRILRDRWLFASSVLSSF